MKTLERACYIGAGLVAVYMLGYQVHSCQTDEVIKSLQSAGIATMESLAETSRREMGNLTAICKDALIEVGINPLIVKLSSMNV